MIARLNIGGPAIIVNHLAEGLDRDTFSSTLVTGVVSDREGDMGYLFEDATARRFVIPELQREIQPLKDLRALLHTLRLLRRLRPDIVHTHTAKAGTIGRTAVFLHNLASSKKIRVVHTFHGNIFNGYFGRLKSGIFVAVERLLARKTDCIIAISETQKRELAEKYAIASPGRIRIIRLGFDLTSFLSCASRRGGFRRRLGLGDKDLLIGIVGRLVPIKNHRLFLDGARILLERNASTPVTFVVVGDGESAESLRKYAGRIGLEGHVRFCGWVKDVSSVYADLDALALTSLNEGTPVSIIEAMASSVPVVSTDVGGVRDLVGHSIGSLSGKGFKVCERGILCTGMEPEGFADALCGLLEMPVRERMGLTTRARRFVETQYSRERLLKETESLYIALADGDLRAGRRKR